jgi:hypothetical protein
MFDVFVEVGMIVPTFGQVGRQRGQKIPIDAGLP